MQEHKKRKQSDCGKQVKLIVLPYIYPLPCERLFMKRHTIRFNCTPFSCHFPVNCGGKKTHKFKCEKFFCHASYILPLARRALATQNPLHKPHINCLDLFCCKGMRWKYDEFFKNHRAHTWIPTITLGVFARLLGAVF